jgi:hypothetical protein
MRACARESIDLLQAVQVVPEVSSECFPNERRLSLIPINRRLLHPGGYLASGAFRSARYNSFDQSG